MFNLKSMELLKAWYHFKKQSRTRSAPAMYSVGAKNINTEEGGENVTEAEPRLIFAVGKKNGQITLILGIVLLFIHSFHVSLLNKYYGAKKYSRY